MRAMSAGGRKLLMAQLRIPRQSGPVDRSKHRPLVGGLKPSTRIRPERARQRKNSPGGRGTVRSDS